MNGTHNDVTEGQCLAGRFANMLILTNDLHDLRRQGMDAFYPHSKNSLVIKETLFALFDDDSLVISVLGKIIVIENIEDAPSVLLQFFATLSVEQPAFCDELIKDLTNSLSKEELEASKQIQKELREALANQSRQQQQHTDNMTMK